MSDEQAPVRLSFSTVEPKLQIAWDSTSLAALDKCPRYYQLKYLEGWTSASLSDDLKFGIEFQAGLEFFDRRRAEGLSRHDAVRATIAEVLRRTWDFRLNRPWVSSIPEKTRLSLCRALVWYFEQYKDDPMATLIRPNGTPAVELSFRLEYGFSSVLTGEPFLACGHLDKVVIYEDRLGINDHKTTKYALDSFYFQTFTPHIQVSQYSFAGQMIFSEPIRQFIIDATQVGVNFARFRREVIGRTSADIEEFLKDVLALLRQNESYIVRNYWPKRPTACHLNGGCEFRPICSEMPALREKILKSKYTKSYWDTLATREPEENER